MNPKPGRNRSLPLAKTLALLLSLALLAAPIGDAFAQTGDRPVPPRGRSPLAVPTRAVPAAPAAAPAAVSTPAPSTLGGAQQAAAQQPAEPLTPLDMAAAQECLAAGQTVYALALQNANVRSAADANSCRVGRVPKGTLVRITGALEISGDSPLVAARAATPAPAAAEESGPRIGYEEDVQPIFNRTCNSCHSGIVQLGGLQVTAYEPLMTGSFTGTVVLPGDVANSRLWYMIDTNRMPLIGSLTQADKQIIRDWIAAGAPEKRPPAPARAAAAPPAPAQEAGLWLTVNAEDMDGVSDLCGAAVEDALNAVSSDLLLPVACDAEPARAGLDALRIALGLPGASRTALSMAEAPRPLSEAAAPPEAAAQGDAQAAAETEEAAADTAAAVESAAAPVQAAYAAASAGDAGVQVSALGLAAPSDGDGWLTPRGGFCLQQRLPKNERGITAIAFAPDGRVFVALDSKLTGESDPLILYDAHHPSRSIGVFDGASDTGFSEILVESTRVTGLDWHEGALYVSRAGEVGMIPDGGTYQTLAGGFAVTSQLFHANNGIVVSGGWVYVSAGGVIDGYSDGPIVGIGEEGAQQIVSGGNPWAARIVRAPLSTLVTERSINAFSTAARGVRNPYGITADPAGRIWFTDNGATNLPDNISAGDEVNVLNPGAIGGGEGATPYYGFPLALSGNPPDWYAKPALVLPNTAAPTGIAWAYDTIWFAQYGRDPGLYRLARGADGRAMAERVLLGWPILAVATAPDGALWIGMGNGGLYRMTPGCAN